MSVMSRRFAAIEDTIAQVRAAEARHGVSPAGLAEIKGALIDLARSEDLFPSDEFVIPEGAPSRLYRLAEDADHRFALYAAANRPGRSAPPHNHTTWAAIAGVRGREHNVFYQRVDNGEVPGQGTLRQTGALTIVPGNAVSFLPDDFHTIELVGDEPGLHLHLYGLSLEKLPARVTFESPAGGTYKVYPASPFIATLAIPAETLKRFIGDEEELAILDVREEGVFSQGHLLFATSAPLSQLELRIDKLVPRRATRVVVVDEDGGDLGQRAARRLFDLGWKNIVTLRDGIGGWKRAGYELFSGIHVPSKAFGEVVEQIEGTPHIEALELKERIDAGEDLLILDSRPLDEFERMSIPGGIACPGAELAYRTWGLVSSPATLVVVNCAGRTRSIIGAQSLINAGLPNRVVALKNGTMGWHLAGLDLAHGETAHAPPPSATALAQAREGAHRVARRFGIQRINRATLAQFEAESAQRTLYRFDVRTPAEYEAGHPIGWRSAPGGQLVQATDAYVGTLKSRLVLTDADGVRAILTASWLKQLGWDAVYVYEPGVDDLPQTGGPEPRSLPAPIAPYQRIGVPTLTAALTQGKVVVIDLAASPEYRAGHIPGAWFAIRARLAESIARLPVTGDLVLTSPDGILAALAAADLAAATDREVYVLDGGTAAWRAQGGDWIEGSDHLAEPAEDVWHKPYDRSRGIEDAMQAYLRWELNLPDQIARDGDARFRVPRK
ncbi:MAG TPA: rhodanese-like domain-containing protein [Aliidongia sp.]|uniref:rhodanese-like domain-containing protein n=1 Tax=Aliidongia sp. TaxID=1914230 RepID=UPI002DDCEC89|nr:rhodanese-like domain-containing protein [Aliidongia sp.]HEV2674896.1 rhodanese-like domain-containing protein [Aliidongia sp.]